MSIVVVGTVAFDAIETPFGKADKILGGAATYICLAAANFCKEINLVSVVGNDFGENYTNLFLKKGINLEGLQIKSDQKCFFWSGKYHKDMNNRDTLSTELNVLADFNPIVPEFARNSRCLMLGNLTPSIQKQVIQQMYNRPELIVLDTMNFWMNNSWNDLIDVLSMIDVLTINDEEARQLSGEYSLAKAAKKIIAMGPKYLIIKKGEHGALLFGEEQIFSAPALLLEEVFDPTGAGDTFAGGFIGYLMKHPKINFESMKSAIIYGSAMASFTCEQFGTERLTTVTYTEIEERVKQFKKLADFSI